MRSASVLRLLTTAPQQKPMIVCASADMVAATPSGSTGGFVIQVVLSEQETVYNGVEVRRVVGISVEEAHRQGIDG